MTDQQDDIEDDVDAPKCRACGVPWTRHLGDHLARARLIAICQQYLETVEELEFVTKERDEARQRLCKVVGDNRDMWGEDVAKEYGWDCFKGAKP